MGLPLAPMSVPELGFPALMTVWLSVPGLNVGERWRVSDWGVDRVIWGG